MCGKINKVTENTVAIGILMDIVRNIYYECRHLEICNFSFCVYL